MENRNFHTALLGGFRKKDVVNFLAEDKRQHEAELKDLQVQLEEAEAQIKSVMEQRDEAQETVLVLRQEQVELQARLEETQTLLEEQKEENRQLCTKLEEVRTEAQSMQAEAQSRIAELETDLKSATVRNGQLEKMVQEKQIAKRYHLNSVGEDPGAAALAKELQTLREQLEAERKRAEALAAKVSQTRQPAEGMDQLWNLCGKMERTLQQMERLMDGPYRMTCYPEPMEKRQGEMREVQTEPCAVVENTAKEVPAPAQEIPSVKSLLQRIRGKR